MQFTLRKTPMTPVNGGFEFHSSALEIQILDKRGKLVWRQQKWEVQGPIRWEGLDSEGNPVLMGDYICKVVYVDGKTAYIPFVFAK